MNRDEQGRGGGSKIGNFERMYFLDAPLFYSAILNIFTLTYAMFEIFIYTRDHARFDII